MPEMGSDHDHLVGLIVDKILATTNPHKIGKLCRKLVTKYGLEEGEDYGFGYVEKSIEFEDHVFKYGDKRAILNFLRFCPYTARDDPGIAWNYTNIGIAYSRYPKSDRILRSIAKLINIGWSCHEETGDIYMGPNTLDILDAAFKKGYVSADTICDYLLMLFCRTPVKDITLVANKIKEYEWSSASYIPGKTVLERFNEYYLEEIGSEWEEHECTEKECCSQWIIDDMKLS